MTRKKHFSEKLESRVKAAEKAAAPKIERGKDKAADFIRLFDSRIDKAAHTIALVGNCADTNHYEYEIDYFKHKLDSLKDAIAAVEARLKYEAHKSKRTGRKLAA